MKAEIHPKYGQVYVTCASCGNEFIVGSTRLDGQKRDYQGREYPSMTLEICSQCHPFFSGKQIYVDTAGRVEKFQRRYGSLTGFKQEAETTAEAQSPKPEEKPKEEPKVEAATVTAAAEAPAKPKKSAAPPPKGGRQPKAKDRPAKG